MKKLTRFSHVMLSLLLAGTAAFARQKIAGTPASQKTSPSAAPIAAQITPATSPIELARAALTAQGGDKFRNLKSMIVEGSAEMFAPNSTQSLTGRFGIATAGDRIRIEIQTQLFGLKQVYDGVTNYSSMRGMELPPASKFGLQLLTKFERPGYTVSALPDKKKFRAFRVVDAEGNTTDFYVEPATGRVMMYDIPFNGLVFSVEHKSFKDFEGVLVPVSFVQKLDTPQGAYFVELKVKSVKLNQDLPADTFAIPAQ